MFKRTNVKILGIIENMTSFTSDDGIKHFIFGKGGAEKIANKFNIELLAQIPIDIILREKSDNGNPLSKINEDNNIYKIFEKISKKIAMKI
jgi:ATP-binding protein involved in chromosome partitioning